jgi:hypothetical protein
VQEIVNFPKSLSCSWWLMKTKIHVSM